MKALIETSQPKNMNKNKRINKHVIDNAVHLACSNYKSALSNFLRKNSKHFRMKYWKLNKSEKILNINAETFGSKGFCSNALGEIKCMLDYEPYNISKVKTGCILKYDKLTNKYTLFVPSEIDKTKTKHSHETIALDPGIRTFMTGLSDNEVVKLGENTRLLIQPLLEKIDNVQALTKQTKEEIKRENEAIEKNKKKYGTKYKVKVKLKRILPKKKAKKIINRCKLKIRGLVQDMHWKIINFLTNKYKTIIIGDMSVKGIVSNDTSKLDNMTKRICYALSFYKFRQKLKYKCEVKNSSYILCNEKYTTKMCSKCTHYNENIGGNKIFECANCKISLDRDLNSSRCIYIRQII